MEWICVKDRHPELYTFNIVFEKRFGTSEPCPISIARWNGEKWELIGEDSDGECSGAYSDIFWDIDPKHISHWMPLPQTPQD